MADTTDIDLFYPDARSNSPSPDERESNGFNSQLPDSFESDSLNSHLPESLELDGFNSPPPDSLELDGFNSPPPEGCPQGGVVLRHTPLKLHPILHLPYNPALKQRAKKLRQSRNLSEVLFWMQVTKGRFHKIDFDRQRIIGNYIVDFYVKKLGLVIEIDGASHIGKEEYDQKREEYLISLGLKIYRIQVYDIFNRMDGVLVELEEYIIKHFGIAAEPPRPAGAPPEEGKINGGEGIYRVSITGQVYINNTQYFDSVPETTWNLYIGG
jgi:very-short-patch-repair endonuclease